MLRSRTGRRVETSEQHPMEGKNMYASHPAPRWAALAAAALLLAVVVPAPAFAKPDPGTSGGMVPVLTGQQCPLTRIGTQFVRCEDLTGAGALAPSWVPES